MRSFQALLAPQSLDSQNANASQMHIITILKIQFSRHLFTRNRKI